MRRRQRLGLGATRLPLRFERQGRKEVEAEPSPPRRAASWSRTRSVPRSRRAPRRTESWSCEGRAPRSRGRGPQVRAHPRPRRARPRGNWCAVTGCAAVGVGDLSVCTGHQCDAEGCGAPTLRAVARFVPWAERHADEGRACSAHTCSERGCWQTVWAFSRHQRCPSHDRVLGTPPVVLGGAAATTVSVVKITPLFSTPRNPPVHRIGEVATPTANPGVYADDIV